MRELNYRHPVHRFLMRSYAGLMMVCGIIGIIVALTYAAS
jgi:hypothetical protein